MNREQLVLKLSAAMLIIFEFTEIVDDLVPSAADYFSQAMKHLGDAVEGICVQEMKETGKVIARPVLEREVAYNEDSFYEDLSHLEKALNVIKDDWNDPGSYHIMRATEALNEGVVTVLVSERRRLAQPMERANPWSVLDAPVG